MAYSCVECVVDVVIKVLADGVKAWLVVAITASAKEAIWVEAFIVIGN